MPSVRPIKVCRTCVGFARHRLNRLSAPARPRSAFPLESDCSLPWRPWGPPTAAGAEPAGGSKTSLATLRRLLARHGVDWPLLWSRVCEVATAALFAAQDAIPHSPNSFELFGFDMMIDAELKVRAG